MDVQRALFLSGVLFGVLAISACPGLRHVQKGGVAVGANVLQRLLVFAVFVAGVVEEGLDDLAAVVFFTVPAGDVTSGQAALFHPALCPAQLPGAVQIPRLAALAGVLIFTAGPAVRAASSDLLCDIHRDELPSER